MLLHILLITATKFHKISNIKGNDIGHLPFKIVHNEFLIT